MAWGLKTHATKLTSITTEVMLDSEITLGVGEHAHLQLKADFHSGVTDYLLIQFYSTLDASSEQWDALPFFLYNLASNYPIVSFIVKDYYKFMVTAHRIGSTDTIDLDMWYRTAIQL